MNAIVLMCFTAFLNCLASLFLKAAAHSVVPSIASTGDAFRALWAFEPYVRNVVLAVVFWVLAFVVYFFALRLTPASQAYAICTGLTIIGLLLTETLTLNRLPTPASILGIGFIAIGIALVSRATA